MPRSIVDPETGAIRQGGPLEFGYGYGLLSPICSHCKHFDPSGTLSCRAFGDEPIPEAIWVGDNDHTTPFPGDHGLLFEPKPTEAHTAFR